jgi:hypothetical protein
VKIFVKNNIKIIFLNGGTVSKIPQTSIQLPSELTASPQAGKDFFLLLQ